MGKGQDYCKMLYNVSLLLPPRCQQILDCPKFCTKIKKPWSVVPCSGVVLVACISSLILTSFFLANSSRLIFPKQCFHYVIPLLKNSFAQIVVIHYHIKSKPLSLEVYNLATKTFFFLFSIPTQAKVTIFCCSP